MKQLRKAELYQWLWQDGSGPVNTGTVICSCPLHAFAQSHGVALPQRLPTWAREFEQRCLRISGTIRGATAYHILKDIDGME